jgi:hypothetical protein
MARTKGAKGKPKDVSEPVEVKKSKPVVNVPKPEIVEQPKPEVKNFIEKPIPEIKKPIKKRAVSKPVLQLEQIQEPVNSKGIPKKYVVLGLIGVSVVLAYFYKDKLFSKYVDWKVNREADKLIEEGILDIALHKEGDSKE